MRRRQRPAVLTGLALVMVLTSGCLELSLFNRESSDTKSRLDALEMRISSLEMANLHRVGEPTFPPPSGR